MSQNWRRTEQPRSEIIAKQQKKILIKTILSTGSETLEEKQL